MTEKEKKIFKYGILLGELGTLAEFNNKTNQGYEFDLDRLDKSKNLNFTIKEKISHITDSFELIKIENQNAFKYFTKKLKEKWFFEYLNEKEYHLTDKSNSFNMFFSDYQQKYIVEFVDFLLLTLNPIKIYKSNLVI
ncbi:hypothetical protein [uncultured Tenacibaculum sp.]|uniref:hypothetical protein n=1 Tax=uncultured Tenacibaculum sp. TaxID=174713 RepID=UPI0026100183|nr:hypothetical protein [uncultured Tenacibaculum sp.]